MLPFLQSTTYAEPFLWPHNYFWSENYYYQLTYIFFLTGTAIIDRFTRLPATISLQQTSNRHHNSSYYDRSFATRQHSRIPLVIKFLRQSTFSPLSGYNIDMLLMFLIMAGEEKNTLWRNTSNVVSTASYTITLTMFGTKETLFLIVKIWWICMELVAALLGKVSKDIKNTNKA